MVLYCVSFCFTLIEKAGSWAGPEQAGVWRPHLSPFTGGDRRRQAARQAEGAAARCATEEHGSRN